MDFLWDSHGPRTAREVHQHLAMAGPIAYTTVATSLQRLAAKGVLAQDTSGRAHAFEPRLTRDDLVDRLIGEALGVMADRPGTFSRFVGRLSEDERARLRSALDHLDPNER